TELVVWSPDTVNQIRVAVSDLVNANGGVLPGANVHMYLVRYVVSNYPYSANAVSCGATDSNPPYLMPDRLEPAERFDLPANSVRPIWVSLDVAHADHGATADAPTAARLEVPPGPVAESLGGRVVLSRRAMVRRA